MALYTGKGDGGTTKLFDSAKGVRVSKGDPIFEALGTLDELNTFVGWAKVEAGEMEINGKSLKKLLHEVQDHLFTIQAEVAGTDKHVPEASVKEMDKTIHMVDDELPEITTFLVPGATELSARLDMARAMSRRAERRLVVLNETGERKISEHSLSYANRLSSLLYAFVRIVNHREDVDEAAPSYL